MTEWSTTRSTGTMGSMRLGSLPILAATERMAAMSASSGTPVKSCSTTRATTKGISLLRLARGFQPASSLTCFSVIFLPSQLRRTDRSEEHTSALQSLMRLSYAVFCLKKKKHDKQKHNKTTYNNST